MPFAACNGVNLYYEVHGAEDLINPTANAGLLAERIAGAELYLVDGGRHGYFIEFREEASGVVLVFPERHRLG